MIRPAARLALPLAAALGLSACAATQEEPAADRSAGPREALGALSLEEVAPRRQLELAREGQLQTPLRLPPELTGAPAPQDRSRDGPAVTEEALAAAGLDLDPELRVWVLQGGEARLDYGPAPTSAANPALSPGVLLDPF